MCKVHGRHCALCTPQSWLAPIPGRPMPRETRQMGAREEHRHAAATRFEMPGPVIRVLVAEDVRVVRETLVALLSLEDDINVVAALASGDRIVPAAVEYRPHVAVLDIDLPGLDGLSAAAELATRLPGCRALILTDLGTQENLRRALETGVPGFLLKDGPAEQLIEAVRAVAHGDRIMDPRLAHLASGPGPDLPAG
jgi:two-component system, NarL family, response regulator DesR